MSEATKWIVNDIGVVAFFLFHVWAQRSAWKRVDQLKAEVAQLERDVRWDSEATR